MLPSFPDHLIQRGVHFASASTPAPLSLEEETISSSFVSSKRRREFALGRTAAHTALFQCLGTALLSLGRSKSGAAVWPAGAIGSISHSAGLAVAAVTKAAPTQPRRISPKSTPALGIDLESRLKSRDPDMFRSILTGAEMDWVKEGEEPECRALILFSGKESVYKAFSRTARLQLCPESIRFSPESLANESCAGTLRVMLPSLETSGTVFYSLSESFIFTAILHY